VDREKPAHPVVGSYKHTSALSVPLRRGGDLITRLVTNALLKDVSAEECRSLGHGAVLVL
jgi:hypothetical protein